MLWEMGIGLSMSESNQLMRRWRTMHSDGFGRAWPMLSLLTLLATGVAPSVQAAEPLGPASTGNQPSTVPAPSGGCLAEGGGYFRARISGALAVDVQWQDPNFTCSGALRPDGRGVRMRFTGSNKGQTELVVVLGISQLKEGQSKAHAIPVNVTVIKQGSGEFYGTRGEDKCMLDEIRQTPLTGMASSQRAYQVVARGFCTEPARAIRGPGAILISRFDFAGRIDFASEDADAQPDNPPSSRPTN
jgi:hypothetical protein